MQLISCFVYNGLCNIQVRSCPARWTLNRNELIINLFIPGFRYVLLYTGLSRKKVTVDTAIGRQTLRLLYKKDAF